MKMDYLAQLLDATTSPITLSLNYKGLKMSEQTEFVRAFERGIDGLLCFSAGSALPECEDCGLGDISDANENLDAYDCASEPSFGWHPCEVCGSTLGGDRFPAHGFLDSGEIIHLSVCVDCVVYHANGEVPDERR